MSLRHLAIFVLTLSSAAELAAQSRRADAATARSAVAALPSLGVAPGDRPAPRLEIGGVVDLAAGERFDLILERFEVATPGATLVVHGASGKRVEPLPPGAYFKGEIAGRPFSRVLVTLHDRELRGLAVDGSAVYMLGFGSDEARGVGRLEARKVSPAELPPRREPFSCGSELLREPSRALELAFSRDLRRRAIAHSVLRERLAIPEVATASAVYAIETDFELYDIFDSVTATADYVLDLLAYISVLYDADVEATILVGTIYLHTTAADPWVETTSACALFEFGRYWNNNHDSVSRTAAVMLAGRGSNSGVAWRGVLCYPEFTYDHGGACPGLTPASSNYGGGYAYVGSLDGVFDINNPLVIWDLVATAHEIGHNFDSKHSHCYKGVVGVDQIDRCYTLEKTDLVGNPDDCLGVGSAAYWENSLCACGTTSYPGTGATTGGSSGNAGGTIMSYCHTLAGGFTNVALTFGEGHSLGLDAYREADWMSSYINSLGSCVAVGLFLDGFEVGATSRWSAAVP